jgi:hypothetical protein
MDIHQLRLLLPNYTINQNNPDSVFYPISIKMYKNDYYFENIKKIEDKIHKIKSIHDNCDILCEFLELNNFIKIGLSFYRRIDSKEIRINIILHSCQIEILDKYNTIFTTGLYNVDDTFEQIKIILNINSRNKLVNE